MVLIAVVCIIQNADGIRFDGYAPLLLDVHRVEHLLVQVSLLDGVRKLEDAIGYGGLPVVDMRHDGEVPD